MRQVSEWIVSNWVALFGIFLGFVNLALNFANRARSARQESIARIADRNDALKVATAHRNLMREINAALVNLNAKTHGALDAKAIQYFADEAAKAQGHLQRLIDQLPTGHADHISMNRTRGEMEAAHETHSIMLRNLKEIASSVKKPHGPFDPSRSFRS